MEVVNLILSECVETHQCFSLVQCIKNLLVGDWEVHICHIHHECNATTNCLAHLGGMKVGSYFNFVALSLKLEDIL